MKSLPVKLFLILFIFFSISNTHAQKYEINRLIPDSIKFWNKGVYKSINEFYTNSPSITTSFNVENTNPDYYLYPGEKDEYFITYYDDLGIENRLDFNDIWGFFDGNKLFVIYKKKPYEMLSFGRISILRYEVYHEKNIGAQVVTLGLTGSTTTSVYKIKDIFLDLRFNLILPRNRMSFEEIISKDVVFYNNYCNDDKISLKYKIEHYWNEYNDKYPIRMSEKGIEFLYKQ